MTLTREQAASIFDYDPETGEFTRKSNGRVGGNLTNTGYLQIRLFGKLYCAHKVAWLLMTGEWPEFIVDHRNRDKTDNAWRNLRKATKSQNNCNNVAYKSSKTGVKGVFPHPSGGYTSQISKEGSRVYLGYFKTLEEAAAAYAKAAHELHGEFACTGEHV